MSRIAERKNTKRVQFIDLQGNPVCNKEVAYNQENHEFLFGSNAFEVSYFVQALGAEEAAKHPKVQKFLDIFNYATLPFYWGGFEKEEGKPNTEGLMKASKFLQERGVAVKGHPLCWHTACADWLLKYDDETIMQKQIDRIYREAGGFAGVIDIWDAINEVVIMPFFDRYDNAVTRICKANGQVGLVKKVFEACHTANPKASFLINDFNMSPAYEKLIADCLDAGIKIDAIGLQSHQHQGYWGLEKLETVLARFEKFGLPIHFTENTFVSGELVPAHIQDLNDFRYEDDASTPEGEERQAGWIKEFYTAIFENHPQVTAITNWDFNDGAWLNAPSGLLRRDGSAKPGYDVLKELINKKWHSEGTVKTDAEGYAEVSGFKGSYSWTCNASSGKFNL